MKTEFQGTGTGIRTAQCGVHPRLPEVVRRHLQRPWRGGVHAPTLTAFEQVSEWVGQADEPRLIFDSGCGTGHSTRSIARAFPDSLVLGIDRSAARLARQRPASFPCRQGNVIWVRAELAAFWRLAAAAGWRVQRHYLLYPNPWPKAGHLRRRWHGHPGFPELLVVGGRLELRTNWRIYAEEFALALRIAAGADAAVQIVIEAAVSSPFERKFRDRGHTLYRVLTDLPLDGDNDLRAHPAACASPGLSP